MGLADDIERAMPDLRRMAESLMTVTLKAYEPNGFTTDADGLKVPAYIDRGFVQGKVQSGSVQGRDTKTRYARVGDVERPVIEAGLHLPIDAFVENDRLLIKAGYQRGIGWEFEPFATGINDDPSLLGRRYLVVEVPAKAKATARRLDVVEV